MALTISLTPGIVVNAGDVITEDVLNALANPTVELEGTIGSASLGPGSVLLTNLAVGILTADATGRSRMADGYTNTAKLADGAVTAVKTLFTGATSKATPVKTDEVLLIDNAASGASKRATVSAITGVRQIVAAQTATVVNETGTAQGSSAVLEWGTGTELTGLALTITPKEATDALLVEAVIQVGTAGGNSMAVGLWRDPTVSGDDALAAAVYSGSDVNDGGTLHLQFRVTAGSTSATTFKFRVARMAAGTAYVNRTGAVASLLNGAQVFSASKVTEYIA